MFVSCQRHGGQHGLLVSRDLARVAEAGGSFTDVLEISYEYMGQTADWFIISSAFATQEGVTEQGKIPLPDDYPGWVRKLRPACEACVKEATGLPMPGTWATRQERPLANLLDRGVATFRRWTGI